MKTASDVDELVAKWKQQGMSKEQIILNCADAEIGWPYVWGAVGAQCTPGNRKAYAQRSSCPAGEVTQIYKTCQYYNADGTPTGKSCGGCPYYPDNMRTLIDDCQGFIKQVCSRVGISFTGGGCSSMWRADSNWVEKGTITTLPETLCCVFWQNQSDKSVMNHIGFYIGGGWMIHCSGTVKKERLSSKCTHWAIPKGLGGDIPVWRPTIRKGSSGEDVKYCQQLLMKLGYDLSPYNDDGKFGNKTLEAVRAFQRSKSLNPDGIVGPLTLEALEGASPAPIEKKYTVTIQHLSKAQADALKAQYPDATIKEE